MTKYEKEVQFLKQMDWNPFDEVTRFRREVSDNTKDAREHLIRKGMDEYSARLVSLEWLKTKRDSIIERFSPEAQDILREELNI